MADIFSLGEGLTHLCGGDIVEREVYVADGWGECGWVYAAALAWIDDDGVVGKQLLVVAPEVEALPVVASHDEGKPVVGIGFLKSLHGDIGIRRFGQAELKVAGLDAFKALEGAAHQPKALLVGHEVAFFFQRIAWRNHEPHFIYQAARKHALSYSHMTLVDGIKRTAEDSDSHKTISLFDAFTI